MPELSPRLRDRRRKHETLSLRLAEASDAELGALMTSVNWRGGWGETGVIEVDGEKVFVKKISLTDIERAGNERRTDNLFDLPLFYQYGVGSAGFGAWRELSALTKASDWALAGECGRFPIVYHWRVLPRTPPPLTPQTRKRIDDLALYWNESAAVRARLEAMHVAAAAIVLFMEPAPHSLNGWLSRMLKERRSIAELEAVLVTALQQLRAATAFMNERGMLHFDLHAQNLLIDNEDLYVCDFGLAICDDFDLSPEERGFLEAHRLYDRCYIEWAVVEWLARHSGSEMDWRAARPVWTDLPPRVRALTDPHRSVAQAIGAFLGRLREDKTTPYPAAALAEAARASGLA